MEALLISAFTELSLPSALRAPDSAFYYAFHCWTGRPASGVAPSACRRSCRSRETSSCRPWSMVLSWNNLCPRSRVRLTVVHSRKTLMQVAPPCSILYELRERTPGQDCCSLQEQLQKQPNQEILKSLSLLTPCKLGDVPQLNGDL